jgi:hypothetical protein
VLPFDQIVILFHNNWVENILTSEVNELNYHSDRGIEGVSEFENGRMHYCRRGTMWVVSCY